MSEKIGAIGVLGLGTGVVQLTLVVVDGKGDDYLFVGPVSTLRLPYVPTSITSEDELTTKPAVAAKPAFRCGGPGLGHKVNTPATNDPEIDDHRVVFYDENGEPTEIWRFNNDRRHHNVDSTGDPITWLDPEGFTVEVELDGDGKPTFATLTPVRKHEPQV